MPAKSRFRWLAYLSGSLFALCAVALLIRLNVGMIFHVYTMPTGSMVPTINVGETVYVLPAAWTAPVKAGEVIVFRYPLDPAQVYVKRVIGASGDRIQLVDRQLIRNGQAISEPYRRHQTPNPQPYFDTFPSEPFAGVYEPAMTMLRDHVQNGELVVPKGQYFVLGDNRDNSADSRWWGFVPQENLIGKAMYAGRILQLQLRKIQ